MSHNLAVRSGRMADATTESHPLGPSILAAAAAVTAVLWTAGGGLSQLTSVAGVWLALGQISGLAAALAALAGLALVARPAWLEHGAGLDRLWAWHRLLGIATVASLGVHVIATAVAYAGGSPAGAVRAVVDLVADGAWMVAAVVAAALFVTVALTSWRRIRTRMTYETWYFVHLVGYLAVLLGFGHQLTVGTDLAADSPAHLVTRLWWISLAVTAVAVIAWSRVGGLIHAWVRGRATLVRTEWVGRDMVAIELAMDSRRPAPTAGQFFLLRFLTADLWWQAHPMSMSARPHAGRLRFTIKIVGDGTSAMARLRPGTRVLLEGPYGTFTAERAHGRPVVLIGAGSGLAPLRAVLEDCHQLQRPVLVARVSLPGDLPHEAELRGLVSERGGRMFVLDGPRRRWNAGRPFAADMLLAAVPDIADRDVYVCGPIGMQRAVERGLRGAGVSPRRIHIERFGV